MADGVPLLQRWLVRISNNAWKTSPLQRKTAILKGNHGGAYLFQVLSFLPSFFQLQLEAAAMTFISIFRVVVLSKPDPPFFLGLSSELIFCTGLSLLFSLVMLGLGANWTRGSSLEGDLFDFEIVVLIAGSLSVLTLPVLFVLRLLNVIRNRQVTFIHQYSLFVATTRKGAFTSKIVVELPCLGAFTFRRSTCTR